MDNFYLKFINVLNQTNTQYLVVGGFAVNFHGYNRTTADLDLWISKGEKNLARLEKGLKMLGYDFPEEAKTELVQDRIVSISEGACIVEIMTSLNISAEVSFQDAYGMAAERSVEGVNIKIISLELLKNEKARSKSYKDLDDLSKLEEAEAYYKSLKKE